MFNDDNKNGGNKLRTYRKLKNSYKMEKFLHSDVDKFALSIFVKIRISNSNLNIEVVDTSNFQWKREYVLSVI